MDSSMLESLVTVIVASLAAVAAVMLVWYVLQTIAYWKIFTKAGEAGWKSIIPYYNEYIMYKITWTPTFYWLWFGLSVLASVLFSLAEPESTMLTVSYVVSLAAIVVGVIDTHKLSKAFGHGIGFTLGLLFLMPIFRLILAFGSSQYQGPQQ